MGTVVTVLEEEKDLEMANSDEHTVLTIAHDDDTKNDNVPDEPEDQLKKISEYKSFAMGMMDIALLTSNANQLRDSMDLCGIYKPLLITLLTLSILLQVICSAIIMVERVSVKKEDYEKCHKYNAVVGVLVICIIAINIVATAFGGPNGECHGQDPY